MNNTVLAVVAIIIVIGGGWFLLGNKVQAPTDDTATKDQTSDATTEAQENIGSQGSENGSSGSSKTEVSTPMPVPGTGTSEMVVTSSVTITRTATGFSPKLVTVKKGTSVTFVNQAEGKMWVGSANHPDHTKYAGTSKTEHCPDTAGAAFDQCATGDSYSFTFDKVGTWGYHNHVAASEWGTVIVTD